MATLSALVVSREGIPRTPATSLWRALCLATLALPLQGCFFVAYPSSWREAGHDAIYGLHGKNCVADGHSVGDVVTLPDGRQGRIKALEGKTYRCKEPAQPIRAWIEPIDAPLPQEVRPG